MIFIIGMKGLNDILTQSEMSELKQLITLPKNEYKLRQLKQFFLQENVFESLKDQIDPMYIAYEIYQIH
jgi:hypothetical protein